MQRTLDIITWLTALVAGLVLVLGLRDTPRPELDSSAAPAVAPPESGGVRLCVEVVNARTKAPLPATVRAFSEREGRRYVPRAELRLDETGRRCAELEPGVYWLLADAASFARGSRRVELERETNARFELSPSVRLTVGVQDELGAPLARATVLVTAADPLPYGRLTDAEGRARFDWIAPGPWNVRAAAPGYESVTRASVSGDLTIALRALAALDVRVVDANGKPAPRASVVIAGANLWPARRAESDEHGVARIRGLEAGSYELRATHGTAVSRPLVGFELARGARESVTLELEPGRMVTALVTDGDAERAPGVPQANVVLTEGGVSSFPLQGRTGPDGKVTLGPITAGPATLAAWAPDFVGGPLVAVPDVLDGPVRIPLARGATLRGDVVDARGYPIGGAVVEVVGTDRFGLPVAETPLAVNFRALHFEWSLAGPRPLIPAGELGVMPGPVPAIPRAGSGLAGDLAAFADAQPAPGPEIAPWVSASNGEFVARPVTPGRVRALVRHPDYVEAASNAVSLASGGEARVRVVLQRGGSIEGRVVDERGYPVPRAGVDVVAARGSFARSNVTAKDGSFAFESVPSKVTISVSRPSDVARVALRREIEIGAGARLELELVLPAEREPIRAQVVNAAGQPIELAEVRFTSLDPNVPLRSTLFTDQNGIVRLEDALGLALRVLVDAPGFSALERSFEQAPAALRFELDPGVLVAGRLTAVRGRRSVSGAVLTLRQGAARKSTMSDADGRYRFSGVAPGPVELAVAHPDYAPETRSVAIERTGRADRAFELPAIDLLEPGAISGLVLDPAGNPVEAARIAIDVAPAYLPQGMLPPGIALSGADGAFVLRGVKPGSLRVAAYAPGVGRGSVDGVLVDGGRTAGNVTIRLSEPDRDDEPFATGGVAVTLGERGQGSSAEVVVVQVAGGSEADRGGLAPGDVLARIDGAAPASMADARTRLAGRAGSDVVLEVLRSGARIALRVPREPVRR